jgi:hypothetical protein
VAVTDSTPVIAQCGLTRDLELFEVGDSTEVGEKGLTLRYILCHLLPHTQALTRRMIQWRPEG